MKEKTQQQKLWDVQLDILNVIDQVCRENNLHYSLYAGTLLGAVRHQGFIPWDDDLDVCMPRDDYVKFLKIWKDKDHSGYILQNKQNTPSFTQSFSKIRKDHTTFLQYEWEKDRYHTGIFVDVFPADRCPDSFIKQMLFRWRCMKYQLFTREFIPPKSSLLIKMISMILLVLTSSSKRKKYRKNFENKMTELYQHKDLPIVFIERTATIKQVYPNSLLEEYIDLPYEGKNYRCILMWDEYLKLKYGNYMELPPEKERTWQHNQLIIDFDHNYGEER